MADDTELRRRLEILRQEMEAGRVKFSRTTGESLRDCLLEVQLGSDGLVDLETVSPEVRALALAVASHRDREDLKDAIPLVDVQRVYFQIVRRNFGWVFDLMTEKKASPSQIADALVENAKAYEDVRPGVIAFVEMIKDFWRHYSDAVGAHVEDLDCLKGTFSGDLFPAAGNNIAERCGMYLDTVVLPDPFLRIAPLLEVAPNRNTIRLVIKHALNVLSYEELVFADVNPPIALVVPDPGLLQSEPDGLLLRVTEPDVLTHFGLIFGRTFSEMSEATNFAASLADENSVIKAIVRPDRVLFDTAWTGTLNEKLHKFLTQHPDYFPPGSSPGSALLFAAFGRMQQANDALFRSYRVQGTPLIDAPTSWEFFKWKLEYDAMHDASASDSSLHVAQALLTEKAGERLPWFGRVPSESLVEIRRQGALPEIRRMLADGVARLANLAPQDFEGSKALVLANIQAAFADYKVQVELLQRKKWRFGAVDIGSWLVTGGVEIAAAITGKPLYGLLAIAVNQFGAPSLKELPKRYHALLDESTALKSSPVGLLFNGKT